MDNKEYIWEQILNKDLCCINNIADTIHADLPERSEVFEEKFRLFPAGCFKLVNSTGLIHGYGISHPWRLYSVPALDSFIEKLPNLPNCMYVHDVAVLPSARGSGAAKMYIDIIKALAISSNIKKMACVSVYGTDVFWARYGFIAQNNKNIEKKLINYGDMAKYMISNIDV